MMSDTEVYAPGSSFPAVSLQGALAGKRLSLPAETRSTSEIT
jgi:hypothetical protein